MRLEGKGLHSGATGAVTITACSGRTTVGCGDDRALLASARVDGRDRCSVLVLPSGREIMVVEHLLSAIVGAGAFVGVRIDFEGSEVPSLDGGSALFFDAVAGLTRAASRLAVRVLCGATFEAHGTMLILEPHPDVDISVEVDFPEERFGRALCGSARWTGDAESYRRTIATARTFGAARELDALRARGLAAHVVEGAVVALDVSDPAWAPSDPDEPIRHKLLDVLGDLAPLGGPLHGRLRVLRPSHRGTRAALALAREVLTQLPDDDGR